MGGRFHPTPGAGNTKARLGYLNSRFSQLQQLKQQKTSKLLEELQNCGSFYPVRVPKTGLELCRSDWYVFLVVHLDKHIFYFM